MRTIHACRVEEHTLVAGDAPRPTPHAPHAFGEAAGTSRTLAPAPRELHVVISGSGFLYNMVRIIAGTLVEVGRGRMPASRVDDVLATKNRRLAGPTLPPNGLCLEWVRYGEGAISHDAVRADSVVGSPLPPGEG